MDERKDETCSTDEPIPQRAAVLGAKSELNRCQRALPIQLPKALVAWINEVEPLWLMIRSLTAIHLPWLVVGIVLWSFVKSGQGISAREAGLPNPWWHSVLCAAAIWGLMVPSIFFASRAATLTCIRRLLPTKRRIKPWVYAPLLLSLIAVFFATWYALLLSAWVLPFSVMAIVIAVRVYSWADKSWYHNAISAEAKMIGICPVVTYLLVCLALIFIGIYFVTNHVSWFTLAGPFCTTLVGVILLASTVQLVLVSAPGAAGSSSWALLLILLLVAMHYCQAPIAERVNPLLSKIPVSGAEPTLDSKCGAAITNGKQKASTLPTDTSTPVDDIRFLISAEGGGIRAAYWAAVSLEEFSARRKIPASDDAVLLSGVSGGSLGLATWVAAQRLPNEARLPCIREFLAKDFLTPLSSGMLFLDIPRLFISTIWLKTHRGDYFERYIADQWWALTGDTFFYEKLDGLQVGRQKAKLYFNATDALSGQFMSFGNEPPLAPPGADEYSNQLNLNVARQLNALPVAQAVHFSARFLYLSPTPDVQMPAREAANVLMRQLDVKADTPTRVASLVDGGYFDNSGLGPTIRMLEDARRAPKPLTPATPVHRVVLHVLNAQERTCEQLPKNVACTAIAKKRLKSLGETDTMGWLTRPLQAILSVRESHSQQRINEVKNALEVVRAPATDAPSGKDPHASPSVQFEPMALTFPDPTPNSEDTPRGVALGWMLSPGEQSVMDTQARILAEKLIKKYP